MWTDVLVKYTYPTLTINYGGNTLFDDQEALAECIASALADYGSTILNRALDSLFSLPDVIAKKLNQYSCATDDELKALKAAELTYEDMINKEKGKLWDDIQKAIRNSDAFKSVMIVQDFVRRIKNIKPFTLSGLFDEAFDEAVGTPTARVAFA